MMNLSSSEPKRSELDQLSQPTVLQFGATWCGHCMAAQPLIKAAIDKFPGLALIEIEDGQGRSLGRSYRVKLWPTLIFLKEGQEIERLVRPSDAASIEAALRKLIG